MLISTCCTAIKNICTLVQYSVVVYYYYTVHSVYSVLLYIFYICNVIFYICIVMYCTSSLLTVYRLRTHLHITRQTHTSHILSMLNIPKNWVGRAHPGPHVASPMLLYATEN